MIYRNRQHNDRINRRMRTILPGPTINITQQGYNQILDRVGRNTGSYDERIRRRVGTVLPGPTVNITQQGYNEIADRIGREIEV